ncbi:hypothetical protein CB1_001284004 [Camelus ferus]|nr:hypothetical protein CB1_001284004 [Camelus ferus]
MGGLASIGPPILCPGPPPALVRSALELRLGSRASCRRKYHPPQQVGSSRRLRNCGVRGGLGSRSVPNFAPQPLRPGRCLLRSRAPASAQGSSVPASSFCLGVCSSSRTERPAGLRAQEGKMCDFLEN